MSILIYIYIAAARTRIRVQHPFLTNFATQVVVLTRKHLQKTYYKEAEERRQREEKNFCLKQMSEAMVDAFKRLPAFCEQVIFGCDQINVLHK